MDKFSSGAYGVVWLYAFRDGSCKTAVKCIGADPKEANSQEAVKKLENDISLYARLSDHDRIVKYYGRVKNEKEKIFAICLEYMDKGSLCDFMQSIGPLDIKKQCCTRNIFLKASNIYTIIISFIVIQNVVIFFTTVVVVLN